MKRTLALMGAMVLAGTSVVGTAGARSIPAFTGRAAAGSQESCTNVNPNNGVITNNCGSTIIYEIGLHADSNGGKTVNMEVNVPDLNATMCREIGISRTGTNFSSNGFVHPSVLNAPTSIILTGAVQVSMGLLFVDCDFGNNATFIQVDWNN